MKMKTMIISVMTVVIMTALLAGCSGGNGEQASGNAGSTAPAEQTAPAVPTAPAETPAPAAASSEAPAAEAPAPEAAPAESQSQVIVMPAPAPEAPEAAPEKAPAQSVAAGPITEEQAKQIALQHAGLTESQAVFARTELDLEHGRQIYEVEFYSGQTEYDYDIDAVTGDVLSFDQDAEYIVPAAPAPAAPAPAAAAPAQSSAASGPITKDQALQIAIQHAGVAQTDVSRQKVEQDYDDGRQRFEVKFKVGRTEYEYDIDAATGQILEFDVDND